MHIQIKEFTGPLDLLLQLIRKEEMNILDIDIHKITTQYLDFIKSNSIQNLDSAGDFIRMAAVLIYLKSKHLFPSETNSSSEEVNDEELRKELKLSLLKMKLVQALVSQFNSYNQLGIDTWTAVGDNALYSKELKPSIKNQSLFRLMKTYHLMFQKKPNKIKSSTITEKKSFGLLSDFIQWIHSQLELGVVFHIPFFIDKKNKDTRSQMLMIFLALLELNRLKAVSLQQSDPFSEISILVKQKLNNTSLNQIKSIDKDYAQPTQNKNQ